MIVDSHIPHEVLSRFLQNEASRAECRWVTRHLMAGCDRCHALAQQVTSNLSEAGKLCIDTADYGQTIQVLIASYEAIERQRRGEVIGAPAIWAKIKSHPQERREMYVRASARCATWGFFDYLKMEAWASRHTDVKAAREIARLALVVTDILPEDEFSESLRFNLRAEAYTDLGNYERILEDFPAAQEYLDLAEECLAIGTGDIIAEGKMLSVRASLLRDVGNYEDSCKCATAAIRQFQAIEESQLEAREWVMLSTVLRYIDPPRGAIAAQHGVQKAEPSNRQLYTLGSLAKIDCMVEAGYGPAALAEFYRIQEYLYDVPGGKHRTNVKFLAGRIAAAVGRPREAMRILSEAIEDYRELELYQEMSMAQLRLVWLFIDAKKWRKALMLSESAIHHLERLGLKKHVLVVWLTVRELLERQALQQQTARRAIEMMARYWKVGIPESVKLAT